jgi:hypothetical protein
MVGLIKRINYKRSVEYLEAQIVVKGTKGVKGSHTKMFFKKYLPVMTYSLEDVSLKEGSKVTFEIRDFGHAGKYAQITKINKIK